LLAAGADVGALNGDGCTALAVAARGAAAHDAKEAFAFEALPAAGVGVAAAAAAAATAAAAKAAAAETASAAETGPFNPLAAAETDAATPNDEAEAASVAAALAGAALSGSAAVAAASPGLAAGLPLDHGGFLAGGDWGRVVCLLRGEKVPPPDPRALVKGCRVHWKVTERVSALRHVGVLE
jgi:hypothetical protein